MIDYSTHYNTCEVVTRLRTRGFSGTVTSEPGTKTVDIEISKMGVEVTLTYNPNIEKPELFCYQICRLWEEKFTQQPVQYIVRNGYGIYKMNPRAIPQIEKVIFNGPATIVIWKDGTKTVVKCDENDIFDPEKGLAMAISKRALGNKGNYCDEFKKWTKDLPEPDSAISTDAYADLGAAMKEAIGYLGHLLDH